MSFLDELRQQRESPATAFHLFLLQYPKSINGIHSFFEGQEDCSFYSGFLLRFISDQKYFHIYKCGSKNGVYETHGKITHLGKPQIITLFFVDKDFSDILDENYEKSENIFVTDYYSIENYLVDEQMLRRIWDELFHLRNIALSFETIVERFRQELKRFYDLFLPITAWIIHSRRNQNRPNVNNVKLAQICSLDDDLTLQCAEFDESMKAMERMCGVETSADFSMMISTIITDLISLEPKKYIRGKFELWFFVKFIEKIEEVLRKSILDRGGSLRVSTKIGESNAVEILGPRARIPSSLETFLRNNLRSFSQETLHG
jgi:hypothetical protein